MAVSRWQSARGNQETVSRQRSAINKTVSLNDNLFTDRREWSVAERPDRR